jgi:hypothetical protein
MAVETVVGTASPKTILEHSKGFIALILML